MRDHFDTPCEVYVHGGHQCCKPSTYRYESMGGGYMHLCDEHGPRHASISEHVSGSLGHIAARIAEQRRQRDAV